MPVDEQVVSKILQASGNPTYKAKMIQADSLANRNYGTALMACLMNLIRPSGRIIMAGILMLITPRAILDCAVSNTACLAAF